MSAAITPPLENNMKRRLMEYLRVAAEQLEAASCLAQSREWTDIEYASSLAAETRTLLDLTEQIVE